MIAIFADLVLLILVAVVGYSEAAQLDQLVISEAGALVNDMEHGSSDCPSGSLFNGKNVACQFHDLRFPDKDMHSHEDYISAPIDAAGAKLIREPSHLLNNMSRAAVILVTFSLFYSLLVLLCLTFASSLQVRITLGVFNFVMISGAILTSLSATLILLVHEYTIVTSVEIKDEGLNFMLLCGAIVSHLVSVLLLLNTDIKKRILLREPNEIAVELHGTC